MKKGFGDLIARKRMEAGMTPVELAERLGRTKGIVYRLESEEQEPDVATINKLISILGISAEQLLVALGVHLNPTAAALLPKQLVERWPSLHPDDQRLILGTVLRLTGGTDRGQGSAE